MASVQTELPAQFARDDVRQAHRLSCFASARPAPDSIPEEGRSASSRRSGNLLGQTLLTLRGRSASSNRMIRLAYPLTHACASFDGVASRYAERCCRALLALRINTRRTRRHHCKL